MPSNRVLFPLKCFNRPKSPNLITKRFRVRKMHKALITKMGSKERDLCCFLFAYPYLVKKID